MRVAAELEARLRGRLLRSRLDPDGPLRPLWWLWRRRWDRPARTRRADLQRFEAQGTSQHGEDGIIAEITARLRMPNVTETRVKEPA